MNTINRSALVVKPAQPFLEWLHRVDPTSTHLTLDHVRLEPTIYLLPEWETGQEALKISRSGLRLNLYGAVERLASTSIRLAWRTGLEVLSFVVRLQLPFDGDRLFFGTPAPYGYVTAQGSNRITGHYAVVINGKLAIPAQPASLRHRPHTPRLSFIP